MAEPALKTLSDMAEAAHKRIQQAHQQVNPVLELRRGMRSVGIPADVMTIDCLQTKRRIMMILHDDEPGMLLYQFITLEDEIAEQFERMPLSEASTTTIFHWMQDYFA